MRTLPLFIQILTVAIVTSQSYAQPFEDVISLNNGGFLFINSIGEISQDSEDNNGNEVRPIEVKRKKPGIAIVLSIFLTGGGQYYNEQYMKGAAFTITTYSGALLMIANADLGLGDGCVDCNETLGGVGALMFLGGFLWSIIDAPISANRINRRNQQSAVGFDISIARRTIVPRLSYRF